MIENKNPNFFKASSNTSEPEVQMMAGEEVDVEAEAEIEAEVEDRPTNSANDILPGKGLKFYKNEDFKQLEHTPAFSESNEKKMKEAEKSINKSKEKSINKSKEKSDEKRKKSPKVIMKFNLTEENEEDVVFFNLNWIN